MKLEKKVKQLSNEVNFWIKENPSNERLSLIKKYIELCDTIWTGFFIKYQRLPRASEEVTLYREVFETIKNEYTKKHSK